DVLKGDDGRDYLYGGLGSDFLDGGTSIDQMVGGAGDDTYVVNNTADKVLEQSGEGTDTVQSCVTYTLGSNVENLTLTGASALNGTGNSDSNKLMGNGAANVLSGGSGDDSLDGGAGNDTLVGGQGADTYLFGLGGGADIISNSDTDLGADKMVFGGGIAQDQLWFARSGSDLIVSVLGTSDRATLQGWYSSTDNQLDHFELSDGAALAAAQVQQLVDAMSGFVTAPANIADLPVTQQQLVETVIAANWHSAG
ncbi:MAG TPA: calcium-binding protein, partial [Dongiaceae bacterium]